jgi:hypothetical protein
MTRLTKFCFKAVTIEPNDVVMERILLARVEDSELGNESNGEDEWGANGRTIYTHDTYLVTRVFSIFLKNS